MLFNSFRYVVFLPVVVGLFYLLPVRLRALLLVLASCYFYMVFRAVYILILFVVIAIDYVSGRYIETHTGTKRRIGLIVSICSNIGILFVFKYYDFAATNAAAAARAIGLDAAWAQPRHLGLLLPIGLSFHTFQSLAYIVEVFYGRYPAEKNPLRFALYVLFFPQMVAGPIERPQGLLRQLHFDYDFSYQGAVEGLRLILIGYCYKMLIADNIAPYVDLVYAKPAAASGFAATLATIGFAVQIYGDFCGYSQIAIGSARILGIRLMTNFNRPYRAASFADFWHRWHISLSTWFRDYVYIPLGGSRDGAARTDRNILIVFLLSGLWHGANWTYVVWGAMHGAFVIVERNAAGRVPRAFRAAKRVIVLALVSTAWVFFRSASVGDAMTLVRAMAVKWSSAAADVRAAAATAGHWGAPVNGLLIGMIAYTAVGAIEGRLRDEPALPRTVRWGVYYALVTSILLLARFERRTFIYFQF